MNKEHGAYQTENCRICKSLFKKEYLFKELMFGFGNEFRYQECSSCGCIQIAEIPSDMVKYYPPYYYSYTQKIPDLKRLPILKRLFIDIWLKNKYRQNHDLLKYLKPANIRINDRILDVGCGKGLLICKLFNFGFQHVEGVDKFIPQEIDHGYGVKVKKRELSDLKKNSYDMVMMHHVLEHMDQQQQTLSYSRELLKKDGCLLVRIPLIGEAWKRYQDNWVQLDAPRHLFLHTLKSMEILAKDTGFEIRQTVFDSTGFQFWASELYKKNVPLFSAENNYNLHPIEKEFNKDELKAFEEEAIQLNLENKGDSAAFYLYKK